MGTSLDSDREEISAFRLFGRKIARWSHKIRKGRVRRKLVNKKVKRRCRIYWNGQTFYNL